MEKQKLQGLGKPRSLTNPFGVSSEVIREKQYEISFIAQELNDLQRRLVQVEADFKWWQEKARTYFKWRESSQTREMQQLAAQMEAPELQKRLGRIQAGYAIHEAARLILKREGIQSKDGRDFQGKRYHISERGDTLTIFPYDSQQPLYVATDRRNGGGIIEVSQFALTAEDRKIIEGYAEYLERQQKESDNKRSRQLER
jgi:hypothetical protein